MIVCARARLHVHVRVLVFVCARAHLEVPVHEALAVQEVDGLGDLQEDVQTLAVLPLLGEATLRHPVLQVLLPTQLHLDVQVHLQAHTVQNAHRHCTQRG